MSELTRMVVVLSLIAGVCSAALTSANYLLDPYVNLQTDLNVRVVLPQAVCGKASAQSRNRSRAPRPHTPLA